MPPIVLPANLRPTLAIDGVEQPALAAAIREVQLDDELGGRATCHLTVDNWGSGPQGPGWLHTTRDLLASQASLRIALGMGPGMTVLFDGQLSGLESRVLPAAPPVLVISAEGLPAFRAVPRKRVFEDLTREDLVRLLAGEHGLQADVQLRRDAVGAYRQSGETDYALLQRETARSGADVWIDGDMLRVADRRTFDGEPIAIAAIDSGIEATVRLASVAPASAREACTGEFVTTGVPPLFPGRRVQITGLGPLHDGEFLVQNVTHTFDMQSGWRSRFSALRIRDAEGRWT